jgi:hypothetical protein
MILNEALYTVEKCCRDIIIDIVIDTVLLYCLV